MVFLGLNLLVSRFLLRTIAIFGYDFLTNCGPSTIFLFMLWWLRSCPLSACTLPMISSTPRSTWQFFSNYYRNLRLSYNFSIVHLATPGLPYTSRICTLPMISSTPRSTWQFFSNNYRNLRLSYIFSIVPVCFVYC